MHDHLGNLFLYFYFDYNKLQKNNKSKNLKRVFNGKTKVAILSYGLVTELVSLSLKVNASVGFRVYYKHK